MKLIEAKNISYKINDRNILDNISFVINFGELVKISGDNGSGKTTTIGKLASQFKMAGKSVMIGAGDTFRAAAIEQLSVWAERLDVPII